MSRNKKPLPLLENVEVIDAGAEGKAIARVNEMVVFIGNAVPGDVGDVQVTFKKKNFMEGTMVQLHKQSAKRTEPFCEHFGVCGGCKWQNMEYKHQLFYKQKQVEDNLVRLGKIELPDIFPILPSANTKYYRNKLEYTFSNFRWLTAEDMQDRENKSQEDMNALGYHIPKRFDKILDIKHCYLQKDPSNAIRAAVKEYALDNHLEFFDLRAQTGFLRNLIIRTSTTGELMVIVVFYHDDSQKVPALLEFLKKKFPEITSLLYVINPKKNDTISDLDVSFYAGKEYITEGMENLKFKVGPKSFYQTNSEQAYELYKITREFAALTGNETVYDLYTGTGTIANFVSAKAGKVVGIEYIPEAIEDAKINSEINGVRNTFFFAGDMKDVLNDEFIRQNGKPDVIITDPPRAGMHEDVVNKIKEIGPDRVVYVSCNPATQARDLKILDSDYKVEKVQPVDMFPHTHHVENVVLLQKRKIHA